MRTLARSLWLVSMLWAPTRAEIVDRISVIVGSRAIKQSDIERDIRVVSFLNQTQLDFSVRSRKASAARLIDQMLIRQDLLTASTSPAPLSEVNQLLAQIKKDRFPNDALYRQALTHYGLTDGELKAALLWQLTVLRFIDQRFPSASPAGDQEVEEYFRSHPAEFGKARSPSDVRSQIEKEISGERANQQFEAWLDQTRKDARIEFREETLR
jgi:hypothetical protein